MKPTLCTCLLLAASAHCLAQPPAHVEAPRPFLLGDSVAFDGLPMGLNCRQWQFKRIEANDISVSQCEDKLLYQDAASRNPIKATTSSGELLVEFRPQYPGLSFPLFVGKKWHSRYSGFRADKNRKWESTLECEARAYEPVRVRAGSFDSIRIECTDSWQMGYIFSGQVRTVRWYAPAVGMVVKYQSEDSGWNYELAALQRQKPGAASIQ